MVYMMTDAVIVLANLMDSRGQLNLESKLRAQMAVEIFNEKRASYLITCGWAYRPDCDIKIADAFRSYIVNNLGINSGFVLTELNSRDTVGDAVFTKVNLAIPFLWKRIHVVTSDYHVARAKEVFTFIYGKHFSIEVSGVSIPDADTKFSNEISSINIFRKTFMDIESGNDEQILNRIKQHHPFYNGAVYPAI